MCCCTNRSRVLVNLWRMLGGPVSEVLFCISFKGKSSAKVLWSGCAHQSEWLYIKLSLYWSTLQLYGFLHDILFKQLVLCWFFSMYIKQCDETAVLHRMYRKEYLEAKKRVLMSSPVCQWVTACYVCSLLNQFWTCLMVNVLLLHACGVCVSACLLLIQKVLYNTAVL